MRHALRIIMTVLLAVGIFMLVNGFTSSKQTATLPPTPKAELVASGYLRDQYAVSEVQAEAGNVTSTVTVWKKLPPEATLFFGLGTAFTLFSLLVLSVVEFRVRRLKYLRACGVRQKGEVIRIHEKFNPADYKSPARAHIQYTKVCAAEVACQHPVTGEMIKVMSMPYCLLKVNRGDAVDVLFDPVNDEIRMVDLTDL